MSTNNYILINENNFDVTIRNADTGEMEQKIGKGKDLKDAIKIAKNHAPLVEYGISFIEK